MSNAIDLVPPPTASPTEAEVDLELLRTIPKAFAIDCEEHANWLVRKIISARQYTFRIKLWADQEYQRAEREEQTLMFLFGRQLEEWARTEIEKFNGRRKSLNLPAGTVGFRTVAASLKIDDEKLVISWAKEHCSLAVTIVESLSRSALKEHFEKTGEMPDEGAHVEPGGERFSIR